MLVTSGEKLAKFIRENNVPGDPENANFVKALQKKSIILCTIYSDLMT